MRLSELSDGTVFRFVDRPHVYVARGNRWYGSPGGYDGGPWCHDDDPEVNMVTPLADHKEIEHVEGNPCPVHDTPHRKIYTYGSSMTGETDVCTFRGCGCAVSIKHDPIGTYPPSIMYHRTFAGAARRGRLHAQQCAAKYR